jgi:O-antigen/teichoic acid export membrane protein
MFPLISEASQEKERFEYYIKICFRYLMSFVFGVCAFITVASPSIVRILYGKEYILSSLALSVLIWSEAGIFLGQIMVYAAIAKELQKFVPISTIIAALINIALNIILIPRWGPVGAAWATVVSYNLGGFFLFLIFPATRYLGLMGVKLSYKPLLIGLFCVIFFGSTRQLFVVFLVPILYLIGLFALNIWNKNDLRIISDILSKPKKEPTFG